MRLLSYNIHKGVGTDRRYRLERIVDVLREESPDLICLQEVDWNVRRSRYHDQPAILALGLDTSNALYQLNVPHREGGYGNLILSRWPFCVQHQVSLRFQRRKPRGAQLVVVDTPEGPVHLVNWHLGLAEKERRRQARFLLEHPLFHASAHIPTLITGDFNDWRNSLGLHAFDAHDFRQITSPTRRFRSFPAFLALASLDKIYCRGPIAVKHTHIVRKRLARRASDHLPLVLDFHLEQRG